MNRFNRLSFSHGIMLLLLIFVANTQAANYMVTNSNDSGTGSLRDTIAKLNKMPGAHKITIPAYLANRTINLNSEIIIARELTISGNKIIIDAGANSRIFKVTQPLTINNMTLKNGAVSGFEAGGAIHSTAKLVINNSTLVGNKTKRGRGGAIYSTADLNINGSKLLQNEAASGGAIYTNAQNGNANLFIDNSTLSHNKASQQNGGAIYALANGDANANITLNNSQLEHNSALKDSGAIFAYAYNANANANIKISHSSLLNNKATSGNGGAIYAVADASSGKNGIVNANITLNKSLLGANQAQNGSGGGVYSRAKTNFRANAKVKVNANIIIEKSILRDHTKVAHGGAVFASSFSQQGAANANVKISKSTLSGNKAQPLNNAYGDGGAVFIQAEVGNRNNQATASSDLSINQSTLTNNFAHGKGGAVFTKALDNAKLNLNIDNSTITANNASQKGGALFAAKRSTSDGKINLNGSVLLGNRAGNSEKNCSLVDSSIAVSSSNNMLDEGCGLSDGQNNNTVDSNLSANSVLGSLANNDCAVKAGTGDLAECIKTIKFKLPQLSITPSAKGKVSSSKAKIAAIENCNINNSSKCTAVFDKNSQLTLIATPIDGNYFAKWAGDCSGSAPNLSFKIDKAMTCRAVFKANNNYTINSNVGANGSISPSNKVVNHGETASFTITANPGYKALVTGCAGSLNGTSYTTGKITKDCTINAQFEPNSYSIYGKLTGLKAGKTLAISSYAFSSNDQTQLLLDLTNNNSSIYLINARHGGSYTIKIEKQPTAQTCTITNGSGTVTANVNNVHINCVADNNTGGSTGTGSTGTGSTGTGSTGTGSTGTGSTGTGSTGTGSTGTGSTGTGSTGTGSTGTGSTGTGSTGTGSTGTGSTGTGSTGTGSAGTGSTGTGSAGTGSTGTGSTGTGSTGTGSAGTGSTGTGSTGTGSTGTGSTGTGSASSGSAGSGSTGTGSTGTGSTGTGSTGTGSTGTGSTGTGSTGTGSTGTGSTGTGSTGTGSTGTGSTGAGSTGTGSAGTGSTGTGSASSGSGSKKSTGGGAFGLSSLAFLLAAFLFSPAARRRNR